MRQSISWKQSALLLAAALAGAGFVLASRPADENPVPAPVPPRALPAAAASPPAAAQAALTTAATSCNNGQRIAEWELLSSGVGGYRESGFAVLHHPQRGTITVTEGVDFDKGLVLQRVTPDSVQLRCGAEVRSLVASTTAGAAPALRSALPDPERSASN